VGAGRDTRGSGLRRAARQARAVLALLLAAAPAMAAEDLPLGCFTLASDPARLAASPADIVDTMTVEIRSATAEEGMGVPAGTPVMYLSVTAADQGHAATPMPEEDFPDGFGGQELYAALTCEATEAGLVCAECGEPSLTVTRHDAASLDILVTGLGLGMGQACGGFIDLVPEGAGPVAYTLAAAPPTACERD
jgi:hypothetical protein